MIFSLPVSIPDRAITTPAVRRHLLSERGNVEVETNLAATTKRLDVPSALQGIRWPCEEAAALDPHALPARALLRDAPGDA